MNELTKILMFILGAISYYWLFKIFLQHPVYVLASKLRFANKYSLEECRNIIGFFLVVVTHLLFVIVLFYLFQFGYSSLYLNFPITWKYLLLAIPLGIGLAGTSTLLCLLLVKLIALFSFLSLDQVTRALHGGWLNSYIHLRQTTPPVVFLSLIFLQLACEEIVFRSIFLCQFYSLGVNFAVLVSTLLFALMQVFHIPTLRGALFPFIGACVMGLVHGYLFFKCYSIWPFIISHFSFFLFFIL